MLSVIHCLVSLECIQNLWITNVNCKKQTIYCATSLIETISQWLNDQSAVRLSHYHILDDTDSTDVYILNSAQTYWHVYLDHFQLYFLYRKYAWFIQTSLKVIRNGSINNISALIPVMAWRHTYSAMPLWRCQFFPNLPIYICIYIYIYIVESNYVVVYWTALYHHSTVCFAVNISPCNIEEYIIRL